MMVVDVSGYIRREGDDIFIGCVSHAVEQILTCLYTAVALRIEIVYLLHGGIKVVCCDVAHLYYDSFSLIKRDGRG